MLGLQVSQAYQLSRLGDLKEVEIATIVAPDDLFIFSPDVSLEVDSPPLLFFIRHTKRLEGNLDFNRPPHLISGGSHAPTFIPVAVFTLPFVHDRGVKLGSQGIGAKEKPILTVVKSIQNDLKGIIALKLIVSSSLIGDDAFDLRIVADHSKEDSLVGVDDSDFGFFGGRLPFLGVSLGELGCGRGSGPDCLIEVSVYARGLFDLPRPSHFTGRALC